jgi:SNF2 family DNA or RNA helicase
MGASPSSSVRLKIRLGTSSAVWYKLDRYQRDAALRCLGEPKAIFADAGTGKTWISMAVIERIVDPVVLIVSPLANIETTWKRALATNLPGLKIVERPDHAEMNCAFIVNHESLWKHRKKIAKRRWSIIIVDESQKGRSHTTKIGRALMMIRHSADMKLILSGTPFDKSPEEMWNQFRFLAPSLLPDKRRDFEDQFFEPVDIDLKKYRRGSMRYQRMMRVLMIKRSKRKLTPQGREELLRRISPHCIRISDSVLRLPKMQTIVCSVRLRGEQLKVYRDMETDWVTSSPEIVALMKVSSIAKLQQITGGHVMDEQGECHMIGKAKVRKVLSILQRRKGPVVIFCNYLGDIELLCRYIPDRYTVETLTGSVSKEDREARIDRFQSGNLDVLICQTRVGGVGVDMFAGREAIFYSVPASSIDYKQARARVRRRGQVHRTRCWILVAKDTIDEVRLAGLKSKEAERKSANRYLRKALTIRQASADT